MSYDFAECVVGWLFMAKKDGENDGFISNRFLPVHQCDMHTDTHTDGRADDSAIGENAMRGLCTPCRARCKKQQKITFDYLS